MIVLKASRQTFSFLGLMPANEFLGKLTNLFLNTMHSFFLLSVNIPSMVFLIRNLADMSKATYSSYCVAATALVLSHYWYFIYQRNAMYATFERLQNLVDKSNSFFLLNNVV